jgi:alpha-1,6-mannosyltransferase
MNGSRRPGVHGNPPPSREGGPFFPSPGRARIPGLQHTVVREVALVASLLPLLAGTGLWVGRGAGSVTSPADWVGLALAAAGWGCALRLARGIEHSPALMVVLASGALALRLAFLAVDPGLSDDVNRYVWEGALVGAGVDPYEVPPDAAELEPFRQRFGAVFRGVDHASVRAVYPPLAQAVNAGVVAAAGGAAHPARARFLLRLFYASCDLLACVPLALLLARAGLPRMLLVAWAWNPWVALEFAGSAHLDSLAILCLLAALACFPRDVRPSSWQSACGLAFLAAGAATKLLPAALVPFALRLAPRPLLWLLFFVLCLVLVVVPFALLTGKGPGLGGLGEYALGWESFSLLHRGIEPLFARRFDYDLAWSDPRRLARAVELALWLGLAAFAWWKRLELTRAASLLVGGALVLSPTLHPWYLAWIVPFLALRPMPAWCALVAASPLLYWPVDGWRARRVWEEPAWLFPVLGGVFWLTLALEAWRARRTER